MPFNGSGVAAPSGSDFPAVASTLIESTKFNNVINDIYTCLTTCLTKDGQSTPTAAITMGGFKITNVAAAAATGDALSEGRAIGANTRANGAFNLLATGNAVNTGVGAFIQNDNLGGVTQMGVVARITASDTATTLRGVYSDNATTAASFTVTNMEHFSASNITKGAGSTITNQSGFYCADITSGTNNYGYNGNVSSGSNKFNLYMQGTADNFLEGKVKVGATAETANGTGTVTVGNLAPGTTALVIKEWWTLKDSAGNTRYIPLFGA